MPYNGSGGFTIINTFVPGTTILSSAVNQNYSDIATAGLSNCLTKDGQQVWGANQKAGGFGITGMAAASAAGGAVEFQQWLNSQVPVGTVVDFTGGAAPSKWYFCFGQAISRTTYSSLFSVIGTFFGTGDGSTTFNVPDLRGRVTAGVDSMGGTPAGRITTLSTDSGTINGTVIGSSGGSQSHVQSGSELAVHNHTASSTDSGHTHGLNSSAGVWGTGGSQFAAGAGISWNSSPITATDTGNASISTTVNNAGANAAMAWLQPTIMCNKIIFANA